MLFSSTIFLFVFLPFTLLGYFLIRKKLRNAFLLMMSIGFYVYGEPKFVFSMLAFILFIYVGGWLVELTRKFSKTKRRLVLAATLSVNLSLLIFYKYYDFFVYNVDSVFGLSISLKNIVLPIGISFFTFQGISYIIDLYLGKIPLQKNLLKIALYIALFPQLVAGPIVRYIDIKEQIDSRTVDLEGFAYGIKRFIIGLGKKVIIANSFAVWADMTFASNPSSLSVVSAWLGAISYALQIYFDFSGYSDMAIGLGKMFGFHFLENFNYPYISHSIQEFWRRWHISLSTWFKDYIYIPLGGNRSGNVYINLLIVFSLTGFWHGASWNFIVWGLWHGMFLIAERFFRTPPPFAVFKSIIKWIYTMSVVLIGWIIFRAPDLSFAIKYLGSMVGIHENIFYGNWDRLFVAENIIFLPMACFAATPIFNRIIIQKNKFGVVTLIFCAVVFFVSISFMLNSSYNPFIYFNF
jgi:alginate O-acetyltransferase complex protein AlgI